MSNSSTNSTATTKTGRRLSKKIIILLSVGIATIVIMLGIIIYLLVRPKVDTTKPNDNRATFITEDNAAQVESEAATKVKAGSYNCQMNVDWNFKDSSTASYNAYVANSTRNEYTVYFDVISSDTNELLYSSPYLPVGEKITEIKLDKNLSAGTYPALVTYHLVDDEHNELSTVNVTVTLSIEN